MAAKKYDDNSMKVLRGPETVRKRPQSVLGSASMGGVKHTIVEITGNALDEAGSGFGHRLEIGLNEDYSVRVRDYGRGVPLGWNENEQDWNYNIVYAQLYAGGKYDEDEIQAELKSYTDEDWKNFNLEDLPNLTSVGLNGMGATATQFTSEWFKVRSFRDGTVYEMNYEKGIPVLDELKVGETDEPNGTEVVWKPDDEVFSNDTKVPQGWLRSLAESISIVVGLEVEFTGRDGQSELFESTTLENHLAERVGEVSSHTKMTRSRSSDGKSNIIITEASVVVGRVPDESSKLAYKKFYQNFVEVKGGAHQEGIDNAFLNFFRERTIDASVGRLKPEDFDGLLTAYVSCRSNVAGLENQTKDAVNANDAPHIMNTIQLATSELLSREWAKGEEWLVGAVDQVILMAENRLQRDELKKRVREVKKATESRKTMPEKFKSCRAYEKKNFSDVELWVSEGDSASGGLAEARDVNYQALFPVRGKSLNLFKAKIDQVLDNKEIADIIQILGAGVDLGANLGEGFNVFDMNKLRCSKFIIAADADVDGLHIRMLLTVLVWRLFPDMIRHGMLYIAETPLYSVKSGGKAIYFYSAEELDEYFDTHGGRGTAEIARYKGLGTMQAEDLHRSTMDPAERRLVQVKFNPDDAEVYDTFEVLFGTSTDIRKKAILTSLLTGTDSLDDITGTLEDLENFVSGADIEDVREFETVKY